MPLCRRCPNLKLIRRALSPFRKLLSVIGWMIYGLVAFSCGVFAADSDLLRPIDLIGRDVALLGEVHQPRALWNEFRESEFFHRLEQAESYPNLLKVGPVKKWLEVDQKVTESTGSSLTQLLLDLSSQELIFAVYLTDSCQPEGVLVTRADDAATVGRVLQTWEQLEPKITSESLSHQGRTYFRRSAVGPRKSTLYYVSFDDVFTMSDHENRIQQVIDFYQSRSQKIGSSTETPSRFRDEELYQRLTPAEAAPVAAVRLMIPFQAWDKLVQESPPDDEVEAWLKRCWPTFEAVTMGMQWEQGVHVAAHLHLYADKTNDRWKAWCAVTPKADDFLATLPADAVLAAAGGWNFKALWSTLQGVVPEREQQDWRKPRRVLQSLLGGRDLLDQIIPALLYDVRFYIVPAPDEQRIPWEGVLSCRFPPEEQTSGLSSALDQAFLSGLTMLSVHLNEKNTEDDLVVVKSDVSETSTFRWLETTKPWRLAYRLTTQELTVARFIQTLQRDESSKSTASPQSSFSALRDRWFPEAGQFLCVNVRLWRDQKAGSSSARILARPQKDETRAVRHWSQQLLELCDTAYLATQFEPSTLTIRFGVQTDTPR